MEYNNYNRRISPLVLVAIICQILFISIMVITISKELSKENKSVPPSKQASISIDDETSIANYLPDNRINDILYSLTNTIILNTENLNTSDIQASIRNDSITFKHFDRFNFIALSFIVDLPNLEQSYQLYYNYPIDSSAESAFPEDSDSPSPINLHILCIDDQQQTLYPSFKCNSTNDTITRYDYIKNIIEYLTFDDFTIRIDDNDPHQINLKPIRRVTDALDETHIAQVKATIESLGVSPDLFIYQILK